MFKEAKPPITSSAELESGYQGAVLGRLISDDFLVVCQSRSEMWSETAMHLANVLSHVSLDCLPGTSGT